MTATPKERPILFNTAMAAAVRSGAKTQTRRPMKTQPYDGWLPASYGMLQRYNRDGELQEPDERRDRWGVCNEDGDCGFFSPFGAPGDRLWVRETWAVYGYFQNGPGYCYRADGDLSGVDWKPSIHMPRRLSRTTLEVLDVRVERLQDISKADAIAEGMETDPDGWYCAPDYSSYSDPRAAFAILWNSVYSARGIGWEANHWVWVATFKRIIDNPEGKSAGTETAGEEGGEESKQGEKTCL